MPFIPHTPESFLPRTDSKNPATTCKGITQSGRPCRRSLASKSPNSRSTSSNGILAVLPGDDEHEGAAAFFCHDHRDQAAALENAGQYGTQLHSLKERGSIDTLVERIGSVNLGSGKRRSKRKHERVPRKETLPQKWQAVQGPVMALPDEKQSVRMDAWTRKRNKPSFWSMFCCATADYEYDTQSSRPRPAGGKWDIATATSASIPAAVHPRASSNLPPNRPPLSPTTPSATGRPNLPRDPSSQTQHLLSWIPQTLSPHTTSTLLSELAKPVSSHDEEGYIYIFWLTPQSHTAPDASTVSSLLGNNTSSSPQPSPCGRRTNDVRLTNHTAEESKRKTILLKIGRASNVQRRMNEWTRQCGYSLTLLRFYPHNPTSPLTSPARPSPSPSPRSNRHSLSSAPPQSPDRDGARKVPHAHRVERLIHLELSEKRVNKECEACGKSHREWFEVQASREGVRGVDEVVRRWVRWGEWNASAGP